MTRPARTRPALAAAALLAVLAVTSCSAGGAAAPTASTASSGATSAPSGAASGATRAPAGGAASADTSAHGSQGVGIPAVTGGPTGPAHADPVGTTSSPPVRVRIPAIGVNSSLQALGIEKDGTLETPSQWQVAGWYADGVRPGDDGPAVIAGHIDSVSGPAVFYRLKDLRPGDAVYVERKDGSTVRFDVARTDEYPKRTFPTEAVYGPTALRTLRLVTCTGDFDYSKRSYVDNLVVTAYAD